MSDGEDTSLDTPSLTERLNRALATSESHQAARGRAVNGAQLALTGLERARDVLLRVGELDEAARVEDCIAAVQQAVRT